MSTSSSLSCCLRIQNSATISWSKGGGNAKAEGVKGVPTTANPPLKLSRRPKATTVDLPGDVQNQHQRGCWRCLSPQDMGQGSSQLDNEALTAPDALEAATMSGTSAQGECAQQLPARHARRQRETPTKVIAPRLERCVLAVLFLDLALTTRDLHRRRCGRIEPISRRGIAFQPSLEK